MFDDFLKCAEIFFPLGDYITVNISSPNTPGLRDFHKEDVLRKLLSKINEIREKSNFNKFFLLKVSPDLENSYVDGIIKLILEYKIDGVILTNTTDKNRENLSNINKLEKGGLSGKPLEKRSNELINKFYKIIKNKVKIIGVGGVDSGQSAYQKIISGASLVQLYTGMIYQGPSIASKISEELINILDKEGVKNISDIVGSKN